MNSTGTPNPDYFSVESVCPRACSSTGGTSLAKGVGVDLSEHDASAGLKHALFAGKKIDVVWGPFVNYPATEINWPHPAPGIAERGPHVSPSVAQMRMRLVSASAGGGDSYQ